MKMLKYYKETRYLLRILNKVWPDYSLAAIIRILTDAKEEIEEKGENEIMVKDLNL